MADSTAQTIGTNSVSNNASSRFINPAAYEAYLRGISYTMRAGPSQEETQLGITMFERAIEFDPNFARAYARLSVAHSWMYFGSDRSAERLAKAKQAVDHAFELQPDLPDAHTAMGYYHYYGFRNYEQALLEFSIAQKMMPNDLWSLTGVAAIHKRQANFQAALQEFKKVLALDPRNAAAANDLGIVYNTIGNYAEAQRYFDLAITLAPDHPTSYRNKVENYLKWTGDTKGVRTMIMKIPDKNHRNKNLLRIELLDRNYETALNLLPLATLESYENSIVFGDCYRLLKKPAQANASYEAARVELEKLLQNSPQDHDLHNLISFAYAGLDRKEEASAIKTAHG